MFPTPVNCKQCRSSPTLATLMVIYKKRFRRYATSRGQMASKQNILIADTILAESSP